MQFQNSYASLDNRLFRKQSPDPLTRPQAGHFNHLIAEQIGWTNEDELMQNWVSIVGGKTVPEGFEPLAMAYAGHQFGHWAGQLGDGRGLLMAQVKDKAGHLQDLHLKGAGMTPYSRMGDGRAVLRSTIREYLCGHAMTQLGVPSSSGLGFVTSDTLVHREGLEKGACLLRVADSHIRLGHFEWINSFAMDKNHELLKTFTEYVIRTYYPDITSSDTPLADFAYRVITRTAQMIADWQLVGFAHGVMNTDNLSITGSTLDYGPFGFMERFNPVWINNHSDHTGRYVYQNQPAIGRWNLHVWLTQLERLTDTNIFGKSFTLPDVFKTENIISNGTDKDSGNSLMSILSYYDHAFIEHYHRGICRKLGFTWLEETPSINISRTMNLNSAILGVAFEFLDIVQDNKLDYTNSFRALLAVVADGFGPGVNDSASVSDLTEKASITNAELNHAQDLLIILKSELNSEAEHSKFKAWTESYYSLIRQYMNTLKHLETSPKNTDEPLIKQVMPILASLIHANPAYVLRGHMAQRAIEFGEAGDFTEVDRLFKLLTNPFKSNKLATPEDITPPDKNAPPLTLSCSS